MRKIFLIMLFIYFISSYLYICPMLSEDVQLDTKTLIEHFQATKIDTLKQGEVKKFIVSNLDDYVPDLNKSVFKQQDKELPNIGSVNTVIHKYGNIFTLIKILAFVCMLIAILAHTRKSCDDFKFKRKELFLISLFAIIQPLNFYINNITEIPLLSAFILMGFVYFIFVILYIPIKLITKNNGITILVALFLNELFLNFNLVSEESLITALLITFAIVFFINFEMTKKILVTMISVLLIFNTVNLFFEYSKILKNNIIQYTKIETDNIPIPSINRKRDIYIIILDEYGGQNTLIEKYNYDNSEFISALKDNGFFVFDKMYSNYESTYASIPSFLNFEYFDKIKCSSSSDALNNAKLFKIAKQNDYNIIFKQSSYFNIKKSKYIDSVIKTEKYNLDDIRNNFFKQSIYADFIVNIFNIIKYGYNPNPFEINHLSSSKNNLVFMHILMPHPPYLYDEFGNRVNRKYWYSYGSYNLYFGYLKYANKKVIEYIENIKTAYGDNQPVIVITGDHGLRDWGMLESLFSTFTAYYNPENNYDNVKDVKTLINFFIGFINYEFGTDVNLQTDKMYQIVHSSIWPNDNTIFEYIKTQKDVTDKYIQQDK